MEQNAKILQPLSAAFAFIQTKDTDILEELHKESRELVVNIIKRISKDTEIPQAVYDSL
jgi:hypothetical protein